MDPYFYQSRIQDQTTATKEEGDIIVFPFFGATNLTKSKIISFWNRYRKEFEPMHKEL